ncbi:MAG: NAD(P)-dependent oxidoreductase [Chloroflexi bacterium]|nr:NAD(P)-dependent oxidoreductase [Chloroflexota bacterium]
MRAGFVGLGRMGRPMTEHLLKAGFEVTVHNRGRAVVDELAQQGARPADSPRAVISAADVVFTALPTVDEVRRVYLDEDGLVPNAAAGQVLVDCSTVGPETSRACAEAAARRGASFLDAPMSGGPGGAAAGSLTFMIGGDRQAFERARPLFEAMGKNVHHVGGTSAGTAIKLVNQLLVAVHTAAASEALVFAVKAGADPQAVLDIIGTSFGGSTMLNRNVPLMIQRKFDPATSVNVILKDLGLIHAVGEQLGTRLLLTSLAEEVFKEARTAGLGDQDMSATVLPLERLSGVEVVRPE